MTKAAARLVRFGTLGVGLTAAFLCVASVGIHLYLATMQFRHDGDNLFFLPAVLAVVIAATALALRYFVWRGYKRTGLLSTFVAILAVTIATLLPHSVIRLQFLLFFSPVALACVAGTAIGLSIRPMAEAK